MGAVQYLCKQVHLAHGRAEWNKSPSEMGAAGIRVMPEVSFPAHLSRIPGGESGPLKGKGGMCLDAANVVPPRIHALPYSKPTKMGYIFMCECSISMID